MQDALYWACCAAKLPKTNTLLRHWHEIRGSNLQKRLLKKKVVGHSTSVLKSPFLSLMDVPRIFSRQFLGRFASLVPSISASPKHTISRNIKRLLRFEIQRFFSPFGDFLASRNLKKSGPWTSVELLTCLVGWLVDCTGGAVMWALLLSFSRSYINTFRGLGKRYGYGEEEVGNGQHSIKLSLHKNAAGSNVQKQKRGRQVCMLSVCANTGNWFWDSTRVVSHYSCFYQEIF
jgi:hypothetical protein